MENRLKQLPLIRILLLLSIPFFAFLSARAPVVPTPAPVFFNAIAFVAIAEAMVAFILRGRLLSSAESESQAQPETKLALQRWFSANIVPWALCLSIAMYGMVLRFAGYGFRSVAPFFAAGFLLILYFPPRRPAETR